MMDKEIVELDNTTESMQQYKQRLYQKVTEMDPLHKNPWRSAMCLGSMMALSLVGMICRQTFTNSLSKFMDQSYIFNDSVWTQLLVAFAEGVLVATCISFKKNKTDRAYNEAFVIFVLSHIGFVMVHGYLTMLTHHEKSTITPYTYYEPVIAALVVFCSTRKPMTYTSFTTLVISSFCAGLMTLAAPLIFRISGTVFLAFLLCIFVSVRNVCCRHVNNEHSASVVIRRRVLLAIIGIAALGVPVTVYFFHGLQWLIPVTFIACACSASVASTYLASRMLRHLNVTSMALLNLWVTVLFNVIFMSSQFQPDVVVAIVGLLSLVISQLVYVRESLCDFGNISYKSVSTEEFYTRLQFMLFCASVGCLVFYALKPSLSERDLNTLSYVGLDGVFRRHLHQTSSLP